MQKIDKTLNSQEQLFAIYRSYKKIGTCVFHVEDRQKVGRNQQSIYPNSWFANKKSEHVFPFLKITGLETMGQKKQGNGRLCLQALLECAIRNGCGGRMLVEAAFNSAPFYEHCGFEGGEVGQDGIKYFDPTEKNLSLLYKGTEQAGRFKFIPLSPQNSDTDKELFNRMLMNAQNKRQRS